MRLTLLVLVLSFTPTTPAIWAQKYPKRTATVTSPDGSVHHAVSLRIRSLKAREAVTPRQSPPPPASGVAQCHVDANGSFTGFFVNTATIASGTTITGSITLVDDNSSINFTGETLSQALPAGSIIFLPAITNFGELWTANGSAFNVAVQVQPPRGTTTEVDCLVLVGESFANSDLANNEPLISALSQSIAGNKDLKLVLNGYFTGDAPLVVLTDQFSVYVAPASAISLVSGSEIDVNLSQIQGLDLSSSDTFFVTVSQAGFSDTVEYRYLPGTPGSFNLAPQ
jgi:hypothetical protein